MSLFILLTAVTILIPLIIFFIIVDIKTLFYITLLSLFFPIHIQLLGRDAFTTGTILIFILFFKYFIISVFEKKFIRSKYDYLIYLLIVFGMLSILLPYYTGKLQNIQIGQSVRLYLTYLSSLLIFLVMKNLSQIKLQTEVEDNHIWVEKLFHIFILMIAVHIAISISVKFFPQLGSLFNIFLSRNTEVFDSVKRGTMGRIGSFVFGTESYGEILAALSPIAIYKIYKFRNPVWFFYLFVFFIGLLFTVTRSGILLFITGVMISTFYMATDKKDKTFILIYLALSALVLLIVINPPVLRDILFRFSAAADTYNANGSIFETVNRDKFPDTLQIVLSGISVFGNGITDYNFHNLFLTTLHRRGIAGCTLFFLVLLYPILSLVRSFSKEGPDKNKHLMFLCFLSMILFLINELKYEFTRGGSYQQLCWCYFAMCYLASKSPTEEKVVV